MRAFELHVAHDNFHVDPWVAFQTILSDAKPINGIANDMLATRWAIEADVAHVSLRVRSKETSAFLRQKHYTIEALSDTYSCCIQFAGRTTRSRNIAHKISPICT